MAHCCVSWPCPICQPNWPQQPLYTQTAGCICPPTSERTCESPICPRKNHLKAARRLVISRERHTMAYVFDKRLPRAPLIEFRRCGKPMFARFRLANAHQFFIWRLAVCIRAPWLDRPARQIYPHLFGLDAVGNPKAETPPVPNGER